MKLRVLIAYFGFAGWCVASGNSWTVMVYMTAKNALECDALTAFAELANVGSQPGTEVFVELGRPKKHSCQAYKWSGVRRFHVNPGSTPSRGKALASDRSDMGKGSTLAAFVKSTLEASQTDHYMLIVWGHSLGFTVRPYNPARPLKAFPPAVELGGVDTLGYDAETDSQLHVHDLADALQRSLNGRKLDIVAFDACLMGGIENAYALRSVAKYMVASEQLMPDGAWNYTSLLLTMQAGGAGNELFMSQKTVSMFSLSHLKFDCNSMLAAFDLSGSGRLASLVSNLAEELRSRLVKPGFSDRVRAARDRLPEFGLDVQLTNFVDLRMLVSELKDWTAMDASVRSAAQVVYDEISDEHFLTALYAPPGSGAQGVSIYFPRSLDRWNAMGDDGYHKPEDCDPAKSSIEFVCREKWADFLNSFLGRTAAPSK